MLDVAIMVEGQHGMHWEAWQRLGRTVEELGFGGLFRSDHFLDHFAHDGDDAPETLDLWPSLTWLADHTETIEFGPLVTPMSFRHPVHVARAAADIDNLADGRLVLGVGAGWQELEHETYGFDLLEPAARFDRFEEGVEVVASLLRRNEPVTFDGAYFQLDDARLYPGPDRPGGTRLLVGGNGPRRTLPLAAAYADEWNAVFSTPAEVASLNERFDDEVADAGRDPDDVRRSLMTPVLFGRDDAELDRVIDAHPFAEDAEAFRESGAVVGTGAEVADHLERLADVGLDRVMLQWLDVGAIDRLGAFADAVL
ncbi:MAG: TIGR03560 family F420-dependent LLM class oxidoreductase [Halobacteriales archaeon]